ncbi:SAM-dependent methyltransferase [Megasphaera cerevisiae DSM 20462]|jgi:cyclopropane-fatty-acyl-phospholipid synthase|uniref:SAM-dependent methyltransferase n=1 Tax=Megasphaera cerevisiae DSM 20462 TaxID=1122219 RepID=A0A0J6WVH6_9FIRM|nr:class I SAM-dependent methyltransferase [Megasphaera cerevisiae]KMO85822.1 SAM-dependent methyltransferase [Megasphaera cerevisiae DSM 20462]MCI1750498.1 class I SAM-dependent methyltransferase [Megasphaera cerevisiae]SKA08998.1 cyclopropane-fatty-acyl-phospholipid synthase [Megasphaera cerevisiae DSM 20462]
MHILDTFLIHYLHRFDSHCFAVELHGKSYTIGEGEPLFKVIIHEDIPKKALLSSTSLALGEAYMKKTMEIEGDLFTALKCILSQSSQFSLDKGALGRILYTPESKSNQKKQVSSHYDLGNDFYQLWLDPSMSYSCAYFKNDTDTLEQAQHNKVHYILEKLHLQKGMTLLDIGCGWGYLLIEAAKKYGIKGYGCTLSQEQWKKGQERIQQMGLTGQVQIDLVDYRDLLQEGKTYDRIVSVGMLEHVGRSNYGLYMETASHLLREGGLFLLHYISGHDESVSNPWMRKYIFPGGTLPSLREIISRAYDNEFQVLDVESLRRHYYKTLMCWYHNFQGVRDQVIASRGEEFARMWDLYLCGCAVSFYIGNIDLHQILMTKGTNNDLPMTRWY